MTRRQTTIKAPSRGAFGVAALAVLFLAAGCDPPDEGWGSEETSQALNGSLQNKGPLTKKSIATTDEIERRDDTRAYYQQVGIGADGSTSAGTIESGLSHLSDFLNHYGFNGSEPTAFYYNRGDLGIGREMHCLDRHKTDGQIACYVKNYFAGDGTTEFGFGMSSTIAFDNMDAGKQFATVAMVFREFAPAQDKVFFAVYGAGSDGALASNAALDRYGLNYALAFPKFQGHPDPAEFGTPGVNFNNHIPTNCINCHGGKYDPASRSVTGGLFLPFDLDQFDYQEVPGKTRADQLIAFTRLNEMARAVAVGSGANQLRDQLDGWYGNLTSRFFTFSKPFNPSYVPSGWAGSNAAKTFYRSIIRPYCRNCHVANFPNFNAESDYLRRALSSLGNICGQNMPHALQTLREFWPSSAPEALDAYYRAKGFGGIEEIFSGCAPGDIVTLDPQFLVSGAAPL